MAFRVERVRITKRNGRQVTRIAVWVPGWMRPFRTMRILMGGVIREGYEHGGSISAGNDNEPDPVWDGEWDEVALKNEMEID